jgi:hypothetical protein
MATLGVRLERLPFAASPVLPSRLELEAELGSEGVGTGINLPDPEDPTRGEYTHSGRSSWFAGLRLAVGWPGGWPTYGATSLALAVRQELGGPRRACALDVCERLFGTTGTLTLSWTGELVRWPRSAVGSR